MEVNMSEQVKKPVRIMETVLRDAHQSLIATRMPTEVMLPIADKMDQVGYEAVEMWGGATFDSCLRFLKEDPWERLRKLKEKFKKTPMQMLLRGQNLLGYSHYSDDVVEYFVQKSIANGIDRIRIFDCLNDLRNLETSVKATKKEGGHAQIALSYTLGDAYTEDYWMNIARERKACKSAQERYRYPDRTAHTLYIRLRKHDLPQGHRSRRRYHRLRDQPPGTGNIPACNRGYGRRA